MLKRLAAVVFVIGLVLPHSCGISPLRGSWDGILAAIMFGIPVLVTIAYAFHQLVPALARFDERHGAALHGLFRALCLVLLGVYLGWVLGDDIEQRDRTATAVTWVIAAGLLVWQQGRGSKAQRLPLLLLTIVGTGAIYAFARFVGDGLQYGGWVFTAGWLLAVIAEVDGLRGAAAVEHGG